MDLISLPTRILISLVLFLLSLILARKKYGARAALRVLVLNLVVVCLLGVVLPFYERFVRQAILIFFVLMNLAIFWTPERGWQPTRSASLRTRPLASVCALSV